MEQQTTTKRIWEIDFLRGLLIPGMILIHLVYDVTVLYRLADWRWPWWYVLLQYNYGALFVALSGVSVTLGSRCVCRGLTVLACGMVCTAVTAGMYLLGMADRGVLIYFGVLALHRCVHAAVAGVPPLPGVGIGADRACHGRGGAVPALPDL